MGGCSAENCSNYSRNKRRMFGYLVAMFSENEFLVVVASVRDEFYDRPSRFSHFWEQNPNIVGGMDFEEGKEGGTWLAMNTNGQIGALLNVVHQRDSTADMKDRGFLVVNFLESEMDGPRYLETLQKEKHTYHPYLLVTLDIKSVIGAVTTACYSNVGEFETPVLLNPGVHVFGSSTQLKPWKKVDAAKYKFKKVLERHPKISKKEYLIKDILNLLADDTPYYPDKQLEQDAPETDEEQKKKLSAIFIHDIMGLYGTRTHTVIMVDQQGNVDYVERTMKEPIEISNGVNWVTTRLQFTIDNPDGGLVSRL